MTNDTHPHDINACTISRLRNADPDKISRHLDSNIAIPSREVCTVTTTSTTTTASPDHQAIRKQIDEMKQKMTILENYVAEMKNQIKVLDRAL